MTFPRWVPFALLVACASRPAPPKARGECDRQFLVTVDYQGWQARTTIECVNGVPTVDEEGPDWKSVDPIDRAAWDAFWRDVSAQHAVACGEPSDVLRTTVVADDVKVVCERRGIGPAASSALRAIRAAARRSKLRRELDICSTDPASCADAGGH